MGSSGGSSSFKKPSTPVPPNVTDYGSTTPFQPNFVNFLGDTNVPSTGLTPDMLKQIDSGAYMKPAQPTPDASASAGAPSNYQQMLNFFGQMMGGGGGRGMGGGGGGLTPLGRAMMAQRNAPTIPAPGAGASAADLAAYQSMQDQQREQLANQMSMAQRQMRRRHAR